MSAGTISAVLSQPREAPRLRRAAIVAVLGLGAFLTALDISIVNAILPVVASAFATDVATIEWVVTTYLLVQSVLTLTVGRLGDMWGHKRVYLIGLAIFVASSVVCAFATSTPFLVVGRALQGIGASMVFTNIAAILIQAFPPKQRGQAVGTQASIVYVGLAMGAPVGGWLAGNFGWQSVFWLNVPLGLLALVLAWRLAPATVPTGRREPFDIAGATIYVPGIALVLLGLNQGHAWGWASWPILGSLSVGLAILVGWVLLELRTASPILDLRLFGQRAFSAPIVSTTLNYVAVSSSFVLPFVLIQGHGLTPAQAGLVLTAQPIVMAVTASFSGTLSDRIGTRVPTVAGMLCVAAGLFLLSRQNETIPIALVIVALLVTGLGIGLFTSPITSAVLGAVPLERRGVANGVLGTARTLGMLLGVALAGALYATALSAGGDTGPAGIFVAGDSALLVASGVAVLGAAAAALPRA